MRISWLSWIFWLLLGALPAVATAQGFAQSCSSDGQPRPSALVERFVSADCADCWAQPVIPPPAIHRHSAKPTSALVLDWVLPGQAGEEAPLSAVARIDARWRWGEGGPEPSSQALRPAQPAPRGKAWALRVAQGPAFNDHIAGSIRLQSPPARLPPGTTAWLALVEDLPAGTEGSPTARTLVRNSWSQAVPTLAAGARWQISTSFWVAPGTQAQRLRVAGWLQNAQGQLLDLAYSRCTPTP